jgi:hypothetical protein
MQAAFSSSALGSMMTGTFVLGRSKLKRWWRSERISLPHAILPIVFVAVVALIQLVAFHRLVSDTVRTGELRLKATALHDKAAWSCNVLIGQATRENCLSQLTAQSVNNTP